MPLPQVIELTGFPAPVYVLRKYMPQRSGFQDEFSTKVLEMKNGYEDAINYFAELIMRRLATRAIPCEPDLITTIPTTAYGLSSLGKRIARLLGRRFRDDVLVVTDMAEKIRRPYYTPTFEERLKSLRLKARIRGKSILLLDDVITSHATMQAALRHIIEGRAAAVTAVALGYSGK